MKRLITIGIFFFIFNHLFGIGDTKESLKIYNKIKKEKIHEAEFETYITHDSIIDISNKTESFINGLCVSGTGT
jgi:hypothetical protein